MTGRKLLETVHSSDEILALSIEDLEALQAAAIQEHTEVKDAVGRMKSDSFFGKYSSPQKFRTLEAQLRRLGWLRNLTQQTLGNKRREARIAHSDAERKVYLSEKRAMAADEKRYFQEGRAYSMVFMRCAKDFLPRDLYEELQRITTQEHNRCEAAIRNGTLSTAREEGE